MKVHNSARYGYLYPITTKGRITLCIRIMGRYISSFPIAIDFLKSIKTKEIDLELYEMKDILKLLFTMEIL